MHRKLAPNLAVTFVLALPLFAVSAADEKPKPEPDRPAESKGWNIHWSGFIGTPGDRSSFDVTLAHDGAMTVKKARSGMESRTVFDGKLTAEEVKRFHGTTTKIIQDYQSDKSDGRTQDAWTFRLELNSSLRDFPSGKVRYTGLPHVSDASPGIKELEKIISQHLKKGEKFPQ